MRPTPPTCCRPVRRSKACYASARPTAMKQPLFGFAAVMTCSSADRGCPIVYGADVRFAVPYVDLSATPIKRRYYDARL